MNIAVKISQLRKRPISVGLSPSIWPSSHLNMVGLPVLMDDNLDCDCWTRGPPSQELALLLDFAAHDSRPDDSSRIPEYPARSPIGCASYIWTYLLSAAMMTASVARVMTPSSIHSFCLYASYSISVFPLSVTFMLIECLRPFSEAGARICSVSILM